ncbi:MAG: hypothetical protein ACI4XA_10265 [Oscillospiraceae bacterium]
MRFLAEKFAGLFRIWGDTEKAQYSYLKVRVIITLAMFGLLLISAISGISLFAFPLVIMLYYWAWRYMKKFAGGAAFFAWLSQNIFIGVIIIMAYIFLGYIVGLLMFLIALFRFIYLLVKSRKAGGLN